MRAQEDLAELRTGYVGALCRRHPAGGVAQHAPVEVKKIPDVDRFQLDLGNGNRAQRAYLRISPCDDCVAVMPRVVQRQGPIAGRP
jgi:hypothetical protein